MPMTRQEIRAFIQGLQQQQPPLSLSDLRGAIVERWLDDRRDTIDAGTETQTSVPGHLIRIVRVAPGEKVPYGWSVLHPVPDPDAPGGDLKACPYNRPYSNAFVDATSAPFVPDHKGYFAVTLSPDGTKLIVGAEVTP